MEELLHFFQRGFDASLAFLLFHFNLHLLFFLLVLGLPVHEIHLVEDDLAALDQLLVVYFVILVAFGHLEVGLNQLSQVVNVLLVLDYLYGVLRVVLLCSLLFGSLLLLF